MKAIPFPMPRIVLGRVDAAIATNFPLEMLRTAAERTKVARHQGSHWNISCRESQIGNAAPTGNHASSRFDAKMRFYVGVTPDFFSNWRPAMRLVLASIVVACVLAPAPAQETKDGPTNEKAQKTYRSALKKLGERKSDEALESFKKADKQDGGHCLACQKQIIQYGVQYRDWKSAELAAAEIVGEAKGDRDTALAHYQFASVLLEEGLQKHKVEWFARTHDEISKALSAYSNFPDALYLDGRALAQLRQDEAAKARFEEYLKTEVGNNADRRRAKRYLSNPELARARMAPPFELTTSDGQRFAMDDLQGKVVLLDFWATWCPPCLKALPHIRDIAKKFQGQPLVILSVSLDGNEQKWKDFIAKNQMTWPQYREAGVKGVTARLFGVTAIPHAFIIDADGVLRDEHIGDASLEGQLKKLIAQAREIQPAETPAK